MTTRRLSAVPSSSRRRPGPSSSAVRKSWIPAFAGMTMLVLSTIAHADTGVGVDTWRANKLDPTAGAASQDHVASTPVYHMGRTTAV